MSFYSNGDNMDDAVLGDCFRRNVNFDWPTLFPSFNQLGALLDFIRRNPGETVHFTHFRFRKFKIQRTKIQDGWEFLFDNKGLLQISIGTNGPTIKCVCVRSSYTKYRDVPLQEFCINTEE
jgi:hypothetical protein